MRIRNEIDRDDTWVAAHAMPVFTQCSGCGFAPLPEYQHRVLTALLTELHRYGRYVRDTGWFVRSNSELRFNNVYRDQDACKTKTV